jgi:LacI family transcriptional regulator
MAEIKISMDYIAKKAGVAKSTVSFTLNGSKNVSPQTKKKVLDIVNKYNYRPNIIASSLKNKISNTIGFIISDYLNPNFAPVIKGIELVASKYNYSLMICESNFSLSTENKLMENFNRRLVDGVILNTVTNNNRHIKHVNSMNMPLVFYGCIEDNKNNYYYVCPDEYLGGFKATEYLIQNNHKRILFLTAPPSIYAKKLREKGYKDALRKYNINFDPKLLVEFSFNNDNDLGNIASGYMSAKKILNSSISFSAIVCWSDLLAIGIMQYCKEKDIKIIFCIIK